MKEKMTSLSRPKTCLEAINQHLENLGSAARWKKTPSDLPEYLALHRKKVLLVDDQPIVIEEFIPHLTVATENNFAFILCKKDEFLLDLAQRIKQENAQMVLLDYYISSLFKGTEVARALVKINHKGLVVGFSSDKDTEQEWRAAKVYAIVEKKAYEPIGSIKTIASIASELDFDKTDDYTEWVKKPNMPLSLAELELREDRDSGVANYQHVSGHGDVNRVEKEDAILYLVECVNTMKVYKVPQDSQNELEIDMVKTKTARENYLKSRGIPTRSIFYPKEYGITHNENGLPVFGKIK